MKLDVLIVIQARLGSKRFPNKVMETVGGTPMIKRIWEQAKKFPGDIVKVVVAWPERYPDVNENDVLERFIRLRNEFRPKYMVRLTADCPLIELVDIYKAMLIFYKTDRKYYNNKLDGKDVQVFDPWIAQKWDKEHVIRDVTPQSKGPVRSVNTKKDLEIVRNYVRNLHK